MSLRVAQVISTVSGVGGAERVLAGLLSEGARHGFTQIVLNPFGDPANVGLRRLCRPVPVHSYPCTTWRQLAGLRRWLQREVEAFQPDIVHVHLFHALVTTATIRRRSRTRWILTHHYGSVLAARPYGWLRQRLDRVAGRRFDRIVGVSRSVVRFLVDSYGYPAARVSHIPNGWQGTPKPSTADDAIPTVVCVANLRPEKGHSTLLEAFSIVGRTIPHARLVLVGDGEERTRLERRVAAEGMGERVEFAGAAEDIWSQLARAHVFALASPFESVGIAIMEAMAAGLPVVASDAGGIPELVRQGVTGVLVPPGDSQALAEELRRLLQSPERRAEMGAAARQAAEAHRLSATLEAYVSLYEDVLHDARR